ncbi:hypothetical protein CPB97_006166 [Podila verticillata]|nr:hypothetical protein CPB97_006166 [Podila verticillata]
MGPWRIDREILSHPQNKLQKNIYQTQKKSRHVIACSVVRVDKDVLENVLQGVSLGAWHPKDKGKEGVGHGSRVDRRGENE